MSAEAGSPLGLGQAELPAHGPAHPRIGGQFGRPGSLVEAAQNHHIVALQPRFQWTQDRQARVAAKAWTHRPSRHQSFQQGGIALRRNRSQHMPVIGQIGDESSQRLACVAHPQTLGPGVFAGCRQRFGEMTVGGDELAQRAG